MQCSVCSNRARPQDGAAPSRTYVVSDRASRPQVNCKWLGCTKRRH